MIVAHVLGPGAGEVAARQNPVVGAVSSVGIVRLRGVPLASEGTLFDGDRIETAADAYVRVQLNNGPRLELGADTDVRVASGDATLDIALNGGTMLFSSPRPSVPVTVSVESVQILAPEGAVAEIAFLAPNRLSVRALAEGLTVAQSTGQETEPVAEGEQVIIDLDAGVEATEPLSTEDSGTDGSGSAKWVLIGAGVGGGAGAAIFLAKKDKGSASPN